MATQAQQVSRLSLRREQILEVQWAQLPDPPAQLRKIPGFEEWFAALKTMRNRDVESHARLVNNLNRDFIIEVRTTDPGNPVTGQIWLRVDL